MASLLDLARRRLRQQRLIGPPFRSIEETVGALTAVQAQDFAGARWAIAQRVRGEVTDAAVTAAFDAGRILRTHLLRPTWHFVLPEDLRWLQRLTAPRVQAQNARMQRQLEVDAPLLRRARGIFVRALGHHTHLTREELAGCLAEAGIRAAGTRLAYLVMDAELEAILCSGPLRGRQHTYALVDERLPAESAATRLDRDAALAELTRRYFTSHGPALPEDFAKWSSLTLADIKAGLALAREHLDSIVVDGRAYWFAPSRQRAAFTPPLLHLLPNYDEFLGYKDYSVTIDPDIARHLMPGKPVAQPHFLVRDGRVLGGWGRTLGARKATISLKLLSPLTRAEQAALAAVVERYARFLALPCTLR